MEDIFLYVVKMSLTAGCVVPVVLLIRLLLKKAPKKYSYLLWSVVGFRLLCPVSFTSRLSFFNIGFFDFFHSAGSSTNEGIQDLTATTAVQGNAAGASVNMGMGQTVDVVGNVVSRGDLTENIAQPIADIVSAGGTSSIKTLLGILAFVWLAGVIVMLAYGMVSYLTLVWKLRKAVRVSGKENVYRSEIIGTPFIMGIVRPVIYIPGYLQGDDAKYVLLHEECHIRRFDHVVKPAAFILLCMHWFNPLIWLAYYTMNKDMEMSCDEKVIAQNSAGYDDDSSRICKEYSYALLKCAAAGHFPLPGILAFGRTSVKERIVNVLDYKKPKRIVTLSAMILCATVLVACSSNPKENDGTVQIEQTQQQTENSREAEKSQGLEKSQEVEKSQEPENSREAENIREPDSSREEDTSQQTDNTRKADNNQESDNSANNSTQTEAQPDLTQTPEYLMPVDNAEISADFGYRSALDETIFHAGVDFIVEEGTEVHAGADGTVVTCGMDGDNGLVVIIAHEGGYSTHYYHLSEINVNEGDKVKAGDIIGYSGATGNVTGPNLHFGVSYYDASSEINYIEPVFSSN